MTDKQIIFDDVDVKNCIAYAKLQEIYLGNTLYKQTEKLCMVKNQPCKFFDCQFKQMARELKAKEQECERLKGDLYFTNEQLKDFKSHYDKAVEECENLREKYLGLKEQKGSYIVQLNTVNEQLKRKEQECEELRNTLEEIQRIANSGQRSSDLFVRNLAETIFVTASEVLDV